MNVSLRKAGTDTFAFGQGYGFDIISANDVDGQHAGVLKMNADVAPFDVPFKFGVKR